MTTERKTPAKAPAAKPRKRSSERTRQSIMNAALKEFSQQGFAGARIDKICRQARCNIRMMYHYFGSKKNLYKAVLEGAYDDILEKEAQVKIDLEQPLEGVLSLLKFVYEYFDANPAFEGLLRAENIMRGKFVLRSSHVNASANPLRQIISDLIESGERKGVFRSGLDPIQVYVTILAVSRFHLANTYSLSALLGTDLSQQDWKTARFEHANALLTAYLAPVTAGAAAPEVPASA